MNSIVYTTALYNSFNNQSEVVVHENDIRGLLGNCSTSGIHRKLDIGDLECGAIICTIIYDTNNISKRAKGFNKDFLIFGGRIHQEFYTTHGSWVIKVSYDPWGMGPRSIVRPMGHGPGNCRTTHGSWARQLSYDPWVMGHQSIVRPMGHEIGRAHV